MGWLLVRSSPLLWAIATTGALLRVARYGDNRSLWLDEAFLALNLKEKSFSQLSSGLEFLQTAPLGFLWAEKGVLTVFGDSEFALRLVPLLASLASLPLFVHVARRLLPPLAALLATFLFATNPRLLYFAAEAKPYASDVAVALLLIALGLYAHDAEESSLRRVAPLAIVAPVALLFSFPAVIVLAAVAIVLAIRPILERGWRHLLVLAAVGAVWLTCFAFVYSFASTGVSRTTDALFREGESRGVSRIADVVQDAWATIVDPGGFEDGTNGIAALLLVVGLVSLATPRRSGWLLLLGLPLFFAAAADLLNRYPLGDRFSLYLVPVVVLLVAAGVTLAAATSRRPVLVGALLVVLLVSPSLGRSAAGLVSPSRSEHVRPLLDYAARHWQSGDTLYVYRNAQYAVLYYGSCDDCDPPGSSFPWPTKAAPPSPTGEQFAPALESSPPELVVGAQGRERAGSVSDVERLPAGRVWVLFSHVSAPNGLDEESLFVAALEERGTRLDARFELNASLYLYELSEASG